MADKFHLGIIAGAESLPHLVIAAARDAGHAFYIAGLEGFDPKGIDPALFQTFGIAEFGKIVKIFKSVGCTHICFAGKVDRPDFRSLKPDLKALKHLPGVIMAARDGDDSLLKYILGAFTDEGFEIISPQTLCQSALMPAGKLGRYSLTSAARDDAEKACRIALGIGALDIGQGAVVCDGLVLAVEAQEGTDKMLERVQGLPVTIRGTRTNRRGVLAKMIKPEQDARIDLPTIGPETVQRADAAGLAGIVAEAGCAFIVGREETIAAADAAGIFIVGLPKLKSKSTSKS